MELQPFYVYLQPAAADSTGLQNILHPVHFHAVATSWVCYNQHRKKQLAVFQLCCACQWQCVPCTVTRGKQHVSVNLRTWSQAVGTATEVTPSAAVFQHTPRIEGSAMQPPTSTLCWPCSIQAETPLLMSQAVEAALANNQITPEQAEAQQCSVV